MSRSKEETEYISTLLDNSIKQHLDDLLANDVKFRVIGDLSHLPDSIRETVQHAEQVIHFINISLILLTIMEDNGTL